MVIESLNSIFENEHFDGLIGFSQGCAMIHFILAMHALGAIKWKWLENVKFCMLVCGMTWNWEDIEKLKGVPLQIPSIHLISESDFSYQRSLSTTYQFCSPLVIEHPFGHVFPRVGRIEVKMMKKYIKKAKEERKQVPMSMSSLWLYSTVIWTF